MPGHPRSCSRADNRTWMPGTRPGMTTIIEIARAKLRRRPNCQQMSSGLFRRLVEEPLAENAVPAPFLQRHFVDPPCLAGMINEVENPVNRNAVAFEDRRHAGRDHTLCPLQRG